MALTDDEKFQRALRELKYPVLITTEVYWKLVAGEKLTEEDALVSEFQRAANISSKAYYAFLKQSGKWTGVNSSVYSGAHRFFRKRELLRIRESKKPALSKKAKLETEQKYDVSSIHLDGEEEIDVPVFDTCDVVRQKIRAFLRDSGMTKSAFCREISKTLPNRNTPLQTGPLTTFLSKSGPKDGNQSLTFYAAYVFFEKLRIRDGKPETEFRLEMEEIWPDGFDRVTPAHQKYITSVGKTLYTDEYGRVRSTW
ncbi:hypothetical protein BDV12DRAFT_191096 [Aspergillus spectabilis]